MSASDESGEETYSLIFATLKHPLRRKIIRMLNQKELTYTQILQNLDIDTGHLNYHLENLGELLIKTSKGKYRLSEIGKSALKLMSGVEEVKNKPDKNKSVLSKKRVAVILLLQILVVCSLFASGIILLTITEEKTYFSSSTPRQNEYLDVNETFYNIDFISERAFRNDTFTTKYETFYGFEITTNVTLWIQVVGGAASDEKPSLKTMASTTNFLLNQTRDGPSYPEQGTTLTYTILVPISPDEPAYSYGNGRSDYAVRIANLGKAIPSGEIQEGTGFVKLTTYYPYIHQIEHPYTYYSIIVTIIAILTTIIASYAGRKLITHVPL
jgi:DNA-binding transcriptional ArsR family regulator